VSFVIFVTFVSGHCSRRSLLIMRKIALLAWQVLDGAGNPWVRRDIAITGDRITFVGSAAAARITARDTLNVRGLLVTPGFWDVHSHAELASDHGRKALPLLYQGVTTVVVVAVNAIRYVGHGSARSAVMGVADREPTAAELAAMKAYIRKGMDEGAVGLSSGLFYSPGYFAKTEEVIELASCRVRWQLRHARSRPGRRLQGNRLPQLDPRGHPHRRGGRHAGGVQPLQRAGRAVVRPRGRRCEADR
jgi:N-acyl-D-aspartate/D-glutamate deacylase